jgi:hypothetical protein
MNRGGNMIRPNLLSRSIFSKENLESPPEFKFPGLVDIVISFFTIFIVIMQQGKISEVISKYPQLNGLLFLYSITCSVTVLYIARRTSQLSDFIKNTKRYKVILPFVLIVLAYFVALLTFVIPTWNDLNVDDIFFRLLILLLYPNTILLFFHNWLWLASVDGQPNNASLFDIIIWCVPYIACVLNIIFIIYAQVL